MKKITKVVVSIFLIAISFFSLLVGVKKTNASDTGGVSLMVFDWEFHSSTDEPQVYAVVSNGNEAYIHIIIDDHKNQNVTIYYHTESGSAVPGVDYTEVTNGIVYSKAYGYGERNEIIIINTELNDMALTNFKGRDYASRSFYVVLDKAVYDDGSELPIIEREYDGSEKIHKINGRMEVMLLGRRELACSGGTDYTNTLNAYSYELSYSNSWNSVPSQTGKYGYAITRSTNPSYLNVMEPIVELGLAKFYATGSCWLSEAQDSEEEQTRFCIGNDTWTQWGGATYGTHGHGWFFGAHINAYRKEFGKNSLRALVSGSSSDKSYWMATGAIDVYDYVDYDGTYWFYNNEAPTVGYSLYRQDETDGKINMGINIRERLFDTTLPKVSELYLDTTSVYATEGIYRLAVRFTEPVQNAVGTKIYAETNILGSSLEFVYAGGEGSDTLYYDCDTNLYENLTVKRITFNNNISTTDSGYVNFRNIKDLGGNNLDSVGIDSKTFDVSLDKRVPYCEVDQVNFSSDVPTTKPTVPVNLMQYTTGTFYYEWIRDDELDSFLNGHDLNSFITLEKLKQDALNPYNLNAGSKSITNTSQDETTKTQVTLENSRCNGNYYLICYAEPKFPVTLEENLRLYKCGPYLVDNEQPTFTNLVDNIINPLDSGGFNRKFSFTVEDNNEVESVTALIKEYNKANAVENRMPLSIDDSGNVSFTFDLQTLIDKFYTNSESKPTVDPSSGFYLLNFEIKDRAGNIRKVYSQYKKFYLSIQPYFEATVEFDVYSSATHYFENVYSTGALFRGFSTDENLRTEPIEVSINGGEYISTSEYTEQYHVNIGQEDENYVAFISFLQPGYYELKYKTSGAYSDLFGIYITNAFNEDTSNYNKAYSNDLLLVNKVIQLSENVQFLYINNDKQIQKEYYGNAVNPTFSSQDACLDFLRYYEYQDLKYEVLTTNTASYLNTGSGEGYNKAANESRTAMSGQVWIRYKRSSWDINSESINDWAYYFYKEVDDGSNTINIEELSANLKYVINQVCEKICNKSGNNPNAYDLYLVDDEHLDDKTRAPFLNENQIALSKPVTYTESKCGSNLLKANYAGDPNLFESKIRKNLAGVDYDLPIATNLKLLVNEATQLFIAPYTEETPLFVKLNIQNGMTLRDAINGISKTSSIVCASGVYIIRELDKTGGKEFYVYIDADAPKLGIKLNGSDTIEYIDSKEVANLFASKLVLASIGDSVEGGISSYTEIDKSAYVALFSLPGRRLYSIYYRGEIPQESIPEGAYLVHIGDRSGNFFSFNIYVSNSAPKIEFKTTDTKVTIKINNRTSDELQELEIYCNDALLSSKLQPEQTFSKNGTYRVVVKDKYSNNTYTETKDFTRLPPQVSFKYYDDGFFPYVEGNNQHMIIKQEDNYQLISTSTRLKIMLLSENTGYDIKGLLPSDYTYIESENSIEFKYLKPFYIDIYNAENTEDVISYRVIVDNTAPTIKISTDNIGLLFDENDANKYSEGNSENPSSIKYIPGGSIDEVSVEMDERIYNDYVSVKINDDTAIKDVKLYQKGNLVKTYTLDKNNNTELSFFIGNVVGDVKIVATDIFGTATSFDFKFADKKISEAIIDTNEVNPSLDTPYYGNDTSTITAYEKTEVHLLFNYNGQQVNQIYKYENGKLYLGKYTLSNSKYGIVDYYNGGIEVINGNEKVYYDRPVTLDINNTYQPFTGYDLYIICDPSTGNMVVKFNASETTNKLIARVNKNGIADYYEIELSKETAKLEFDSVKPIIISEDYVYTSTKDITINYDLLKISNIKVAYNPIANEFNEEDYIYTLNNMFDNDEGYYCIKATNIYGNTAIYHLIYSSTINASIELSYIDKSNETYTVNYADTFYTNSRAIIKGYKLNKLEGVTDEDSSIISSSKFGEEYTLVVEKSSVVTLEDIYGNKKVIHIYVSTDPTFKYDEDDNWIIGFDPSSNDKEGYSKEKLSINLSKEDIDNLGISQIRVICEDTVNTLYGYDGLNFIDFDSNKFNLCIGNNGTNIYSVLFANQYGDVIERVIHYSEEPTLIIKRQTSSSVKEEEISITEALNNGVWSNREIILSSLLTNNNLYKFYVKGDGEDSYREVTLPYSLQLATTSQNGTLRYSIKYADAYGYSYEIPCTLNKHDIDYVAVNMDFIDINQVSYTKDTIVIKFSSDCTATYILDSLDEVNYISETKLYNDGNYTFTIKDNSGNVKTITFIKDSLCKYKITSPDETITAYNGGVINTNTLVFNDMDDSSYIKYAKYNGNVLKVTDEMSFTKTGLYELIVEDAVKNTSYFYFYLINHSINEFNYTVPNTYIITEVYRTYNDLRSPFMDAVNNDKTQLNLSLEGKYDIILKNIYQDSTINFYVEINKDEPKAKLVGCEENEVTTADISIRDVGMDDIVEVYKDGELIARYDDENQESFQTILVGGKYDIVVTNPQGVSKTLSFTKKNIANTSLSILIMVLCTLLAGGFFIGLLIRNRSKFDD